LTSLDAPFPIAVRDDKERVIVVYLLPQPYSSTWFLPESGDAYERHVSLALGEGRKVFSHKSIQLVS
jgi:hypothetical protein